MYRTKFFRKIRGKEFKRFWYTRIDGVHTGGEVVVLGVLAIAAVIWVVFTTYAG